MTSHRWLIRAVVSLVVLVMVAAVTTAIPLGSAPVGAAPLGGLFAQLGGDVDGEANDEVWSVAMSADGETVIVGAPGNDRAGRGSGHARIFDWNGTSWVQRGGAIEGERGRDFAGFSVAMAADGNTVIVGAPGNDRAGRSSGHARIFDWDGNGWVQRGIDIDGKTAGDRSGWSVAMSASGDTVIIGAPGETVQPYDPDDPDRAGHARVFDWDGDSWVQRGGDINGKTDGEQMGWSVAMSASGDTVTVGAPRNSDTVIVGAPRAPDRAGHARIFDWDGGSWVQRGRDLRGRSRYDEFGGSVAISNAGDTVIVGTQDGHGYIRIFDWVGSSWVQRGGDIDGARNGNDFGWSVAMSASGDTVIAGARNRFSEYQPGQARIYRAAGLCETEPCTRPGVLQDGNPVYVTNVASARYLSNGGIQLGHNVDTSSQDSHSARWYLVDNGDDTWSLLNQQRTRYLDADGPGANWNVNQSTKLKDDDRWQIFLQDDGSFRLRNIHHNRWLNEDSNHNVDVAETNREPATQWHITPVP